LASTIEETYSFRQASSWSRNPMPAPETQSVSGSKLERWDALDIARGFAIILMILSHCVKGLLAHYMLPDWGVVPIHLITKFSSSLFIVVFGMSLSLYFLPHVGKSSWKTKRWWMLRRGVELMIWYKILTVVQMFQFYSEPMILETLLFKRMPDFVEILCFYSIALMWIPFVLPFWSRRNSIVKLIMIFGLIGAGQWLHYNSSFWGFDVLKALLVENDGYYTFGQFQRGGLVFLGLLLGDTFKSMKASKNSSSAFPLLCIATGAAGLAYLYLSSPADFLANLDAIARNQGKHPMGLNFMCFSLGGALVTLGSCLLAGPFARKVLKPISYLGKNSLKAFVLHILIIFYLYRFRFLLHHNVSYEESLALTFVCIVSVLLFAWAWNTLMKMISLKSTTLIFLSLGLLQTSCVSSEPPGAKAPWVQQMKVQSQILKKKYGDDFGIYVKNLESKAEYSHNADQYWYLSSTIKVPVAISLLKLVDQNKIQLSEKVKITKSAYRDGAGPTNWIKPGKQVTYKYLLDQMLLHSDNAATDLIIKRVGIDFVNKNVAKWVSGEKFGAITSLLDVRKKAYSEFHPGAQDLSNMDFFSIKKQRAPEKKLNRLAKILKISRKELRHQNLTAGFNAYYGKHWNSAHLTSYGELLEKLAQGKVLSARSTEMLLEILSRIHTGKKRIKKGLPKGTFWAHKTGTQHKQACDVGIAGEKPGQQILILVCVKNWKTLKQAEKLMSKVSRALAKTKIFKK